jgi:hypothetical protein
MIVFVLIALVWERPLLEKPDSGIIQLEFDSISKCEEAKKLINSKFSVTKSTCLEIKK